MANLIADAMLEATSKQGAVVGFINAGGVRAGLDQGQVTYGEAIAVQPFGNTLVLLEVSGKELKRALEDGVAKADKVGGLLYPSKGTSYVVDMGQPAGSRISKLLVAGKPYDEEAKYLVSMLSFTASGGDFHGTFKEAKGKRSDTGIVDLDALIGYIKSRSPIQPDAQARVIR
jgi:5'-nucleotidase